MRSRHLGRRKEGSDSALRGLHCLSAFSAFPTNDNGTWTVKVLTASPLPFGVQCVPDQAGKGTPEGEQWVSIAFRRSVRSRPGAQRRRHNTRCGRLHCLSAFSAFPTGGRSCRLNGLATGLHCLSAFSAFPTRQHPHRARSQSTGLHCLSAFSAFPTALEKIENLKWYKSVSIAFRRSVRSRLASPGELVRDADGVSIAFRRSVRSRHRSGCHTSCHATESPLPFGVQCVPDSGLLREPRRINRSLHCLSAFSAFPTGDGNVPIYRTSYGLHCLSAFSAFPTGRRGGTGERGGEVSIAFRRSVRSRPGTPAATPTEGGGVSIAFRRSVRSRPGQP